MSFTCPNCGADVPHRAKVCPECGSDEKTGWSEDADTPFADIPDEEFDYGEFVKREFGAKSVLPRGVSWFWWIVAVLVLAAFVFLLVPK